MEKYGDMEIHFIIKLLRGYLQKVGCNKKYKNVLNSIIIDYFVHYQMLLTIIFLYKNFKTKKKGYAGYTVSGVTDSTPDYLTVPLQIFLENFLGIQQHKKSAINFMACKV